MTTEFIYKIYVSGEKHIVGFGSPGLGDSPGQATMFTDSQIEELKNLPEDQQEDYAKSLMPQPIDPQLPNQSTGSF